MPNRLAPYNPDQVVIYLGGRLIQGFADGEFMVITPMSPAFEEVVGTDGEVARSRTNDRRKKVVIKLLQTSKSNADLTALHKSDLNTPNGAGVGAFLAQDLSGFTIHKAEKAWIVSDPESNWDRTAKAREWEIHTSFMESEEGGN